MVFAVESPIEIAVIGGSGLYEMQGLQDAQEIDVTTPYGVPSERICVGRLGPARVAFLARHARGHKLLPSEIPFLANIWALKSLGVRYLLSVSAVGSLIEDFAPLDLVLPDQFIDHTRGRPRSFFGEGAVAHVSLADPICPALRALLAQVANRRGFGRGRIHHGGTYICIDGPQFSSRAESLMYRQWGAQIIGMTNMPEARLAREAEIAYATLALVTDYDCWHERTQAVTADMAVANLMENASNAQGLLIDVVTQLHAQRPSSPAHEALSPALITPVTAMGEAVRQRLAPLLARFG
ncbi:MAG: S-methyl-5'-thioadenosine phosphorylase [Betaproteobacteria bacterium]|nr:S-methyl-5'-thioadenosine phosphorylase [Betaproteobacteria bacterium]